MLKGGKRGEMNYPDSLHVDPFQMGLEFQDFVMDRLRERYGLVFQMYGSRKYQFEKGESPQGAEIKLDQRCSETGRLSIEVAEKSNRSVTTWTPSGIMRDDNTMFYIQGNEETFFMFFKKHLQLIYNKQSPEVTEKHGTIKTFYIGFDRARDIGLEITNGI